jgi:hypothetical protein
MVDRLRQLPQLADVCPPTRRTQGLQAYITIDRLPPPGAWA